MDHALSVRSSLSRILLILLPWVTVLSQTPPDPHGTATKSPGGPWPSWWKLGGEVRGRLDSFTGLPGAPGDDDSFYLHRIRLNSSFQIQPAMRIFVQAQDSRVMGYERTPCPKTVANSFDLRQAYFEAGNSDSGWRLRAGRQNMVFGDMRLVSTSNWGNVGPGFDAVRAGYRRPGVRLDAWGSFVVLPVAGMDRPRTDRRFHGIYSSFDTPDRTRTVESYFLWKDYRVSRLQVYTYGVRSLGKLTDGFTYNLEIALQNGHAVEDRIRAWAGHWEVGRPLWDSPRAVKLSAEYNYSTGDGNGKDGRRGTFDQLFATNVYGTATDFGWRNLHEPVATVDWSPRPKWRLKTSYHHFWLADRTDAIYTLSGAVWVQNAAASEDRIGGEIDFRVVYQVNKHLQLWCGYAHLFAGPYLKEAGRDGVHYPYAMWTYVF